MSLLNVHRTDERAIIVVDSAGLALDDGTVWACAKAWVLLAQDAVLASRGGLLVGQAAASLCGMLSCGFDEMADAFPAIVQRAHQHAVPQAAKIHVEAIQAARAGLQEIVLVGFSPRLGRVRGLLATCPVGGADWHIEEVREWLLAPGSPSTETAEPTNAAQMLTLAQRQKAEAPETIGGKLRMLTVREGEVSTRVIGEL